jgi:hypothetical protein
VGIEVMYVLICCRRVAELETVQQAGMGQNETKQEKKRLKFLFWCFSPILFLVFLRLYWMLFQFIYGTLFIILFGKQFADTIAIIALITSLLFAVFTFLYIYRQYKKHIIEA